MKNEMDMDDLECPLDVVASASATIYMPYEKRKDGWLTDV